MLTHLNQAKKDKGVIFFINPIIFIIKQVDMFLFSFHTRSMNDWTWLMRMICSSKLNTLLIELWHKVVIFGGPSIFLINICTHPMFWATTHGEVWHKIVSFFMIPAFSLLIFALILCFEQQQKTHPMRMKINFNPKF